MGIFQVVARRFIGMDFLFSRDHSHFTFKTRRVRALSHALLFLISLQQLKMSCLFRVEFFVERFFVSVLLFRSQYLSKTGIICGSCFVSDLGVERNLMSPNVVDTHRDE